MDSKPPMIPDLSAPGCAARARNLQSALRPGSFVLGILAARLILAAKVLLLIVSEPLNFPFLYLTFA